MRVREEEEEEEEEREDGGSELAQETDCFVINQASEFLHTSKLYDARVCML